jgi:hypothetical protein
MRLQPPQEEAAVLKSEKIRLQFSHPVFTTQSPLRKSIGNPAKQLLRTNPFIRQIWQGGG